VGFGEEFAALAEGFEVEDQGVAKFPFDFRAGPARDDTTGEIRGIGGVAGAGFFDDDEIFFHDAGKASQSE